MVNGITLSTPHCISIVATFIYKRLLRQRHRTTSMPLDLSRYPLAQDVHVRSHDLETYDELARKRNDKSWS
jgi:hypothetical protein